MADEELDGIPELEELDDIDVDFLDEDILDEVGIEEGDDISLIEDDEDEILVASPEVVAGEEEFEEEEDYGSDDIEAGLDVILKSKVEAISESDDEDFTDDEGDLDYEDRLDPPIKVLPKQKDEFVCQSCFLVKKQNQLADKKRKYCRDCV